MEVFHVESCFHVSRNVSAYTHASEYLVQHMEVPAYRRVSVEAVQLFRILISYCSLYQCDTHGLSPLDSSIPHCLSAFEFRNEGLLKVSSNNIFPLGLIFIHPTFPHHSCPTTSCIEYLYVTHLMDRLHIPRVFAPPRHKDQIGVAVGPRSTEDPEDPDGSRLSRSTKIRHPIQLVINEYRGHSPESYEDIQLSKVKQDGY